MQSKRKKARKERWRQLSLRRKIFYSIARTLAVVVIAIGSVTVTIGVQDATSQEITQFKIYVLLFLGAVVVSMLVVSGIRAIIKKERRASIPERDSSAKHSLIGELIIAGLLLVLLAGEPDILFMLGYSIIISPVEAAALGLAAYAVLIIGYDWSARVLGVSEILTLEAQHVMRRMWPRRKRDHWKFYISVCVLNPFLEELIFRGILVSLLAYQSGSLVLAVMLGLSASIVAHLYQGWRLAPFHVLFHGMAIALLFSPGGLLSCIAMHFAGDFLPVVKGGQRMRRRLKELDTIRCRR